MGDAELLVEGEVQTEALLVEALGAGDSLNGLALEVEATTGVTCGLSTIVMVAEVGGSDTCGGLRGGLFRVVAGVGLSVVSDLAGVRRGVDGRPERLVVVLEVKVVEDDGLKAVGLTAAEDEEDEEGIKDDEDEGLKVVDELGLKVVDEEGLKEVGLPTGVCRGVSLEARGSWVSFFSQLVWCRMRSLSGNISSQNSQGSSTGASRRTGV